MSIQARYSGTCSECGGRWQPGDLIRAEEYPLGSLPEWKHAVCPVVPSDYDPPAGTEVCPKCWLYHAGECDR